MKDNISIIFAALIGVFLVVLLPLFSLLDRQDSMAYNVVLTATTNFVDKVRTNGFIDTETYNNYIAAMASTGNTYKVSIKAYKKILINENNDDGVDSFVEQKELYNTKDILAQLEADVGEESDKSIYKNNVYLFGKDDEIYVSVENTNITTGSLIYSLLANVSNTKIIDINYGGVINNINWELYDKITTEKLNVPEVIMSVPVNANNVTNIAIVDTEGEPIYIDCTAEDLSEELKEVCEDIEKAKSQNYAYLYDLSIEENKNIRVAVELRGIDKIDTGEGYKNINELREEDFNNTSEKSSIEQHIIKNYIRTYGMYVPETDIELRKGQDKEYYVFDIYFKDVMMSSIEYISTKATIAILPGLGQDEKGTMSLGAESVEIELLDENAANTVTISGPYIWEKYIRTKSLSESAISTGIVYAYEDIAFVVSYTGIKDPDEEQIIRDLEANLNIQSGTDYEKEIISEVELKENYDIDLSASTVGRIVIKLRYREPNSSSENYISINDNWTETNMTAIDAEELEYEIREKAMGAQSSLYQVMEDNSPPLSPDIILDGILGQNNWYTSPVNVTVIPSTTDTIQVGSETKIGGSGVFKNTLELTGMTELSEQEIATYEVTANGTTEAIAKAYDYIGNVSEAKKETIKIDQEFPTAPKIEVVSGSEGTNGWYTTDLKIKIIPGTDNVSGVQKTTYTITGADASSEKIGDGVTIDANGTSTIIATTYDNAGNKTESLPLEISIDKTTPPEAAISVISGKKRMGSEWYYTDVKLRLSASSGDAISGFGGASYKIIGTNEVPVTQFNGNETEITLDRNGTYTIVVYTYTLAGKSQTKEYRVQIDKDAPNKPTIDFVSGTTGENGWYKSNVKVNIVQNGDVGHSLEGKLAYTITKNGKTSSQIDITNTSKQITFNEQGEYILTVYSWDMALNEVKAEQTIKIDWTAPTSAEFVITGTQGKNGWYTSPVNISYKEAEDGLSGINQVTLSHDYINGDTNGTEITLTTKDNAGNITTKTETIKIDQLAPKAPRLDVLTEPAGQDGPFGVLYYNTKVKIKLTPGQDYLIDGVDNTDRTMCEISYPNGETKEMVIENEQELEIAQAGNTTIAITTYDKAGNSSYNSKNIVINDDKPQTPIITSINGESVEGQTFKEITSNMSTIDLDIDNLVNGNTLTITLINQDTSEEHIITQIVDLNKFPIKVELNNKGKYRIFVTQTNIFGTISEESTGLYYYIYE